MFTMFQLKTFKYIFLVTPRPKMKEKTKLMKTVTIRIPEVIWEALQKKAKDKRKEYARYSESDAVRSAIINDLKSKGYLDKGKDYL